MVTGLMIFLYGCLLLVAISNLVIEYKRVNIINAYICFQAGFILYYILIPILANLVIEVCPNQLRGFVYDISCLDFSDRVYAFVYTFVSYLTVWFTYSVGMQRKSLKMEKMRDNSYSCKSQFSHSTRKAYRFSIISGILALSIGLIGELFVSNTFGGILKALTMGDVLRSFGSDRTLLIPQNRLFMTILMVSSLASVYFFVYARRIKNGFTLTILLFVSILASVFFLVINAGRLGILLFVVTFFADAAFKRSRHPFVFMGIFAVVSLVLLGALNDLFFYLSYGSVRHSTTDFLTLINEFAFPYLNLVNVHKINEIYGLRWGLDYVTWAVNIVPTAILKIFGLTKAISSYQIITEYHRGSNEFGGIPTDILTLGIRQFGVIGAVVLSAGIARLCNLFDKVIYKIHSEELLFLTLRISSIMFVILPYADLDAFVRNRYDMILVFVFAVIVSKWR